MTTITITTITKTGIPRTESRAGSVNPGGRPASGTWWLPAMRKSMPRKMLRVPSVATIDGTRRTVTTKPLTMPEDEAEADPEDDGAGARRACAARA